MPTLKEMFGKGFILVYCPYCGRVFKNGMWITLLPDEVEKLSTDHRDFTLTEEKCSFCIEVEVLVGCA